MRRYHRLLALVLAAVLLLAGACARAQEQVQALFINVGKADAALFFLDDQRFLVDTGTKDSYDQLERVLEAYGVTRLNGVVITHTDKDHVGGLKKLLKSGISVDRVYAERSTPKRAWRIIPSTRPRKNTPSRSPGFRPETASRWREAAHLTCWAPSPRMTSRKTTTRWCCA